MINPAKTDCSLLDCTVKIIPVKVMCYKCYGRNLLMELINATFPYYVYYDVCMDKVKNKNNNSQ